MLERVSSFLALNSFQKHNLKGLLARFLLILIVFCFLPGALVYVLFLGSVAMGKAMYKRLDRILSEFRRSVLDA